MRPKLAIVKSDSPDLGKEISRVVIVAVDVCVKSVGISVSAQQPAHTFCVQTPPHRGSIRRRRDSA